MMYGGTGVIALFILLLHQDLPPAWPWIIASGLAAGGIHGIGNFIRMESLRHIDSVIFFPLNKLLGPLLVVVGGVAWFGDSLNMVQYAGVALSLTVPLLLITSVEVHRQKNLSLGLQLMAVCSVITAVSLLLTKQGFSYGPHVLLLLGAAQVAGTITSAAILIRQHGASFVTHADRRDVILGLWSAFFGITSAYSLFVALSTGLVSLVYVIQAHYILIPIVLSVWWYRDHINARKFLAVVVSFSAIALLAL